MSKRFSGLVYTNLARWSLNLNGCVHGKGLQVYGPLILQVSEWGSVSLGESISLISRRRSNLSGIPHPVSLQTFGKGRITIGDNSGMSGAILSSRSAISIGKHVKLGVGARIYDHDYHSVNYLHRRDGPIDKANVATKEIVIGDDVFVGGHSIILKGTRIGDRSIVGAGSVVAGLDIPPDSLVAGNPAKVRRKLSR